MKIGTLYRFIYNADVWQDVFEHDEFVICISIDSVYVWLLTRNYNVKIHPAWCKWFKEM